MVYECKATPDETASMNLANKSYVQGIRGGGGGGGGTVV